MADDVAPEFAHFIAEARQADEYPDSKKPLEEGELANPVFIDGPHATELLRVAARRAVGLFRPSRQTEVVWGNGDSELAINLAGLGVKLDDGLIDVLIPARCDQTGSVKIEVAFAVGTEAEPAGLFAATHRRPNGPPWIVEAWGENLVAFAWQCVLGMVSGIAGATGKDARGNILVPVELTASKKGIKIVPMARYRFSGSSKLPDNRPDEKKKTRGEK